MKYFVLPFYFIRSIILRGPVNTAKLLVAELTWEKKFLIKTARIKKSDSNEFFHYQGASYLVLLRIFKMLSEQTKRLHFVDIGCGKGRAIFVAEYSGFTNLSGIELDPTLIEEAKENEKSYAFKRNDSQINFILGNALDVNYNDQPTLYFLFNPFNEEIMTKVIHKILRQTKSETWFVYMNPLFTKPFEQNNIQMVSTLKTGLYTEAIIYRLIPL